MTEVTYRLPLEGAEGAILLLFRMSGQRLQFRHDTEGTVEPFNPEWRQWKDWSGTLPPIHTLDEASAWVVGECGLAGSMERVEAVVN